MEKSVFLFIIKVYFFLFIILGFAAQSSTEIILRANGVCPWVITWGGCDRTDFQCSNRQCIGRSEYCNGYDDCGDNSDEQYCAHYSDCPSTHNNKMRRCRDTYKCIPDFWFCDGITDCPNGADEKNCVSIEKEGYFAIDKALNWLDKQKNSLSPTGMWGSLVDKSAVALYLGSSVTEYKLKDARKEMAYEISIQLLSRLSGKKLQDIPTTDLASYLNAFLVTCLDPRKFHGLDIVQELRSRVNGQNYTNPYVFLSLCNAGETVTESDKMKLIETFWNKRRIFWTDMQAIVVMALACASRQPGNDINPETLRGLAMELKQRQFRNGTVENLQTTALVMQALISVEPDSDPDNFDETKAMQQILAMQKSDGSFGNLINTYYVLPVLNCKSLVNISSDHCERSLRDEISALDEMTNRSGPKIHVRYSVWIGNGKDLERTLTLKVTNNISFYSIMEMAAEIDSRFRFEYIVKNRKPYVNALSGLQDDPERGKFWFLYTVNEGNETLSQDSPADVTAKENDHFVMWYRSGSWLD